MKFFYTCLVIFCAILLVSCSNTNEPKIVGKSPNNELKAAFAFENSIYSIGQGWAMGKDIVKEIGTIDKVVEKINGNGEAKIYDSSIDLKPGAKIYQINEQDKDTVIAIKVDDKYYTAIFNSELLH